MRSPSPSNVRTPGRPTSILSPPLIPRLTANTLFAQEPIRLFLSQNFNPAMWNLNSGSTQRLSSKTTSVWLNGYESIVEKANSDNTQYRQISAVNFSDQDGKHEISISNFYLWHAPELGFDFFVKDSKQSDCLRQLIKAADFMDRLKKLYGKSIAGPQTIRINLEWGRIGPMDEIFSPPDQCRPQKRFKAVSSRAVRMVKRAWSVNTFASDNNKSGACVNLTCRRTGNSAEMSIEPVSSSPGASATNVQGGKKRVRP